MFIVILSVEGVEGAGGRSRWRAEEGKVKRGWGGGGRMGRRRKGGRWREGALEMSPFVDDCKRLQNIYYHIPQTVQDTTERRERKERKEGIRDVSFC